MPGTRAFNTAADADGTIAIVNLDALRPVEELPHHNGPDDAVAWLPDGRTVIHGGLAGHVMFWDVKTGRLERTLRFADTVQTCYRARMASCWPSRPKPPTQ